MWQMGGAGPLLGQAHHFVHFNPEKSEYAKERYQNEARRLYGVLDKRLSQHAYMGGDEYSIADIATWPWISRHEWQAMDLNEFDNIKRWYVAIAERPAVQRGFVVPNPAIAEPQLSKEALRRIDSLELLRGDRLAVGHTARQTWTRSPPPSRSPAGRPQPRHRSLCSAASSVSATSCRRQRRKRW